MAKPAPHTRFLTVPIIALALVLLVILAFGAYSVLLFATWLIGLV